MSGPPALLDDGGELLELALRAEEGAQLDRKYMSRTSWCPSVFATYPLLGELTSLLILDTRHRKVRIMITCTK